MAVSVENDYAIINIVGEYWDTKALNDISIAVPPCVVALIFSFYTKSKMAGRILFWSSIWYISSLLTSTFLSYDCEFNDFAFGRCALLSDSVARSLSVPHLANLFSLVTIAPALATIALSFEIYTRKFKS